MGSNYLSTTGRPFLPKTCQTVLLAWDRHNKILSGFLDQRQRQQIIIASADALYHFTRYCLLENTTYTGPFVTLNLNETPTRIIIIKVYAAEAAWMSGIWL